MDSDTSGEITINQLGAGIFDPDESYTVAVKSSSSKESSRKTQKNKSGRIR